MSDCGPCRPAAHGCPPPGRVSAATRMTPDTPASERLPGWPASPPGAPTLTSPPARGGAGGDHVGGIIGRSGVVAAQRSHEVGNRVTGVALVDPVTLGGKVTRWRLDGMGSLCALNAVGDNRAACWPSIAV